MWWLYLAIALYTLRNAAGFIMWSEVKAYNQTKPDYDDIFLGLFGGVFAGAAWPIYWAFRALHYSHYKWIKESEFKYTFWIPKPREIETRQAKKKRKEAERNASILSYQQFVNDEERANGLPLTKWNF